VEKNHTFTAKSPTTQHKNTYLGSKIKKPKITTPKPHHLNTKPGEDNGGSERENTDACYFLKLLM